MDGHEWRTPLARYGAPIAFLAAATAAALLVRAGLNAGGDTSAPAAPTVTQSVKSGKKAFYRVHAGDSLSVVADRFHTTLDDLIALNPQIDPNALKVGQRLRIH